jgi:hypothetical protein
VLPHSATRRHQLKNNKRKALNFPKKLSFFNILHFLTKVDLQHFYLAYHVQNMKSIKTKPINYVVLDLRKTSFHHTTFEPINLKQTTHQLTRVLSFFAFGNLICFSLGLHLNDVCCTSFHPTQ